MIGICRLRLVEQTPLFDGSGTFGLLPGRFLLQARLSQPPFLLAEIEQVVQVHYGRGNFRLLFFLHGFAFQFLPGDWFLMDGYGRCGLFNLPGCDAMI